MIHNSSHACFYCQNHQASASYTQHLPKKAKDSVNQTFWTKKTYHRTSPLLDPWSRPQWLPRLVARSPAISIRKQPANYCCFVGADQQSTSARVQVSSSPQQLVHPKACYCLPFFASIELGFQHPLLCGFHPLPLWSPPGRRLPRLCPDFYFYCFVCACYCPALSCCC